MTPWGVGSGGHFALKRKIPEKLEMAKPAAKRGLFAR